MDAILIIATVVLVVVGMAAPPLVPDRVWRVITWCAGCGVGLLIIVRRGWLEAPIVVVIGLLSVCLLLALFVIERMVEERKQQQPPPEASLFNPDLIDATFGYGKGWLVLGLVNHNPTIPDAALNLLVPASLQTITRADYKTGAPGVGSQLFTPELIGVTSAWIYWAEVGLRLRRNLSQLSYFRLGNPTPGTYSIVCRVIADELGDGRAEIQGTFEIRDSGIGSTPPSREVLRVLNEQLSQLRHQRELAYEWRTLRLPGSGINENADWKARRHVLHGSPQYSKVYAAIDVAWLSLDRLVKDQTQFHKDDACTKIDAAIVVIEDTLGRSER